jgi:DNA (cytosine-5)-methyltransferase 1
MTAYYNEWDKSAAAWLRELIAENLIAPGVVDERSIEDVTPGDLAGFTQCHFFAGLGGWSRALRLAGVPDSRPVWTGSCPCQPFSSAGEGAGFADERHLWPYFHHLISVRRPGEVLGEQTAGNLVDAWLDLVQVDMEGVGYAFGALAFPSAGIGAPHIRDRTYWAGRLGDTDFARLERLWRGYSTALGYGEGAVRPAAAPGGAVRLADADRQRGQGGHVLLESGDDGHGRAAGGLADAARGGRLEGLGSDGELPARDGSADHGQLDGHGRPGPTNGFWRDADWLFCRDGRWRPVESGTFPLAHGVPDRVALLRGAGNAVNVYAAKAFIEAFYGSN